MHSENGGWRIENGGYDVPSSILYPLFAQRVSTSSMKSLAVFGPV
jgi:hypothetical protein